jgi:iron(III) transport system ATP-binding protein
MEIIIEHISKVYEGDGGTPALTDVTIRIEPGEFFFLLGPSGCGKTTLLRIVAGLIDPASGRILFNGRDVTHLPVEKRNSAMVFQNYALWPHMTVRENVEFGPRMQHLARDERGQMADEQLARVQVKGLEHRKPNQLSGGQQQRVALARALAAGADCLLLDEPLSNLDARLRLHMRGELRSLIKSSRMTAIYVTHDQKEALSMADRMAVMNKGRIIQSGTPRQLYDSPETMFVADFLGEANFIQGRFMEKGPPAKVETPIGPILASAAGPMEAGASVTCCIRPERIIIADINKHDANKEETLLPAKILSYTYLGEICQYVCSSEGHEDIHWKITGLTNSNKTLEISDRIGLRIRAGDVTLLRN